MRRFLFWTTFALGAGLLAFVLAAPLLDDGSDQPSGWAYINALFARDVALRQTSIAAAVGLGVTACVFFRTHPQANGRSRRHPTARRPRPGSPMGA